jgi:hypothetical protein
MEMSELPQFRDTIAAATETLRSLSSLEAWVVEAADLIEQCRRVDLSMAWRKRNYRSLDDFSGTWDFQSRSCQCDTVIRFARAAR